MRRKFSSCRPGTSVLIAASLGLLALVAVAALAPAAQAQSAAIDRDGAVSLVTRTQLGGTLEGVRLYVHPRMLATQETVSAWHKDVFTAPAPGWLIFVDRYPGANWEHPCWYMFVDAATGEVRRFDATTPPTVLSDLIEITHGHDNPPPGVSEESLARFSERLSRLPKPPQSRGQAYALIISGGANQSNNHIRYWNDCAFIYRALVQYYGYADDHIRVCISDGTSPAIDRSDGTNSPTDLDGDGDADIEYPATLAYVGQVFNELASTLTASDQLFIFTTDHGGQESGHDCYLNLWNNELLRDDQMAGFVAALPCQSIICSFEQCYSGGMIDDLTGDGRVIATGAAWNELSWAMGPDYVYDTFVYYWTCAVGWATPAGTPVNADTNNDGLVSMHEAFLYAELHDTDSETPQYDSTPAELGDMLNLFGNMAGVYLTLDGTTIDDDNVGASHGDGDGVIEYGETIELGVSLHNLGQSEGINVIGTLAATSPYVTLINAVRDYPSIPPDGTAASAQPFVFSVAPGVPNGEALGLSLGLSEEPGTVHMDLSTVAPAYVVEVAASSQLVGDGDDIVDPGETFGLTLRFRNQGGCPTPNFAAALQNGTYLHGDGVAHAVGTIPVGGSVDVSGFSFQALSNCPSPYAEQVPLALTAPESYSATAGVHLAVGPWFDDAETEMGWTLGALGDNATSGWWIRADPVGTTAASQQVQPENDHSGDPGHMCFVTGNGAVGGAAEDSDVDGGITTLLSPIFDMQNAVSASLTYWRWYTNNLGTNPYQDYWDVDVSSTGLDWVHLEHTNQSANSWTEHAFGLQYYIPLTSTIRFRFIARDSAPNSLVEAAVDDIVVTVQRAPSGVATGNNGLPAAGLGVCRPNPIGAGSVISYRVTERTDVQLDLYDVAGRRVRSLFAGSADAGEHTVSFTPVDQLGNRIAAGVYFLRLDTPALTQVRQVTIVQ